MIKDLGQGKLGLQDRQFVAIAGGAIFVVERIRKKAQPFAQQDVDLRSVRFG